MIDHEKTMQLLKLARNGDEKAKNDLVIENMPLIKSIVKRFRNGMTEYDDLIQLGALGLVKAINNFDLSYNVRFSTYAVPMIIGEIKRFLRDDGIIKVSRAIKTLQMRINRFVSEYNAKNGKDPDVGEIADYFNVEKSEVVFALDSSKYPLSIYESVNDDDNLRILDKISSNENTEDNIDKMLLRDYVMELPERERKIIVLRYFRDKTQSDIAREFGISQVQISRIENKVLKILRSKLECKEYINN